jgi:hypothetical protein
LSELRPSRCTARASRPTLRRNSTAICSITGAACQVIAGSRPAICRPVRPSWAKPPHQVCHSGCSASEGWHWSVIRQVVHIHCALMAAVLARCEQATDATPAQLPSVMGRIGSSSLAIGPATNSEDRRAEFYPRPRRTWTGLRRRRVSVSVVRRCADCSSGLALALCSKGVRPLRTLSDGAGGFLPGVLFECLDTGDHHLRGPSPRFVGLANPKA